MEALADFFAFLQCSLRMEAQECLGLEVGLEDPLAREMWRDFEEWAGRNLGKREKWMPFHTVLGTHELFIVEKIHPITKWDGHSRFLALFIYRAHCKGDLFERVQVPHMCTAGFWENPCKHFEDNGAVTMAMLEYRRTTKAPLQTAAFRCVPARITDDPDENLVINIARRTQTLLEVAAKVWPMIQDRSTSSVDKFINISAVVRQGKGMGDTWIKMLMVSIDIAFPDLRLLADRCEVGSGAIDGLKRLLPDARGEELVTQKPQDSLRLVRHAVNARCDNVSNMSYFWELLLKVELSASRKYANLPMVARHMCTADQGLSAGTVQVQLCEWRQFHDRLRKISSDLNNVLRSSPLPAEHSMRQSEEPGEDADDGSQVRGAVKRATTAAGCGTQSECKKSRPDQASDPHGGVTASCEEDQESHWQELSRATVEMLCMKAAE